MSSVVDAVIFDIDGTLLDSAAGIVAGFRHTLQAMGIEPPTEEVLHSDIGPPVPEFLARAGVPPEQLATAVQIYRAYYREFGLQQSYPYPGVSELLERLNDLGVPLGTATAKRTDVALAILDHHHLSQHFAVLNGRTDNRPDKASTVDVTLRQLGDPDPTRVILLGDRGSDMAAAHHWGLTAVAATWGYGSIAELTGAGASVLLDQPLRLLELIEG